MKTTVRLLVLGGLVLILGYLLHAGGVRVPDPWNPWAPLAVSDPPNWLTGYKLGRLSDDAALCRTVLAEADMVYDTVPDQVTGPGCGFANAVRIEGTTAGVGEPFTLSCRTAVALAVWEAHVLQPAALEELGASVTQVEHFGSYACRNVGGGTAAPEEGGRRSRHATADALDLAGFVLEDGRRIRVLGDWVFETGAGAPAGAATDTTGGTAPTISPDTDESRFLRALHRGACRIFDGVLGPEYNAAHHDHFHLEMGGFRMCR